MLQIDTGTEIEVTHSSKGEDISAIWVGSISSKVPELLFRPRKN